MSGQCNVSVVRSGARDVYRHNLRPANLHDCHILVPQQVDAHLLPVVDAVPDVFHHLLSVAPSRCRRSPFIVLASMVFRASPNRRLASLGRDGYGIPIDRPDLSNVYANIATKGLTAKTHSRPLETNSKGACRSVSAGVCPFAWHIVILFPAPRSSGTAVHISSRSPPPPPSAHRAGRCSRLSRR